MKKTILNLSISMFQFPFHRWTNFPNQFNSPEIQPLFTICCEKRIEINQIQNHIYSIYTGVIILITLNIFIIFKNIEKYFTKILCELIYIR